MTASAPAALCARGSESAVSSSTGKPCCASRIAGAISSASESLPEPYFCCASARPATVPGTPTASPLSRDFVGSGLPLASRNMVARRRRRRGLAIVDGDVAVAFGEMDHHEAAAAEIAGARIGDREREADRHRRVDRVAAAVEDLDADAGGALSCATTMPLWARIAVAGGMTGVRVDRRDLGVSQRRRRAARGRTTIRDASCFIPVVPAKAGTQRIVTLAGFPLARE